MRNIL